MNINVTLVHHELKAAIERLVSEQLKMPVRIVSGQDNIPNELTLFVQPTKQEAPKT